MANKKKQATPGTVQYNKLIAELPAKKRTNKNHWFNSDMTFYNHKNGLITIMNLIDYKV